MAKKFVWDTSSLSHAFEDLTHSIGSVASYCYGKGRCDFKRLLRGRYRSAYDAKNLITDCDENTCLIPNEIYNELIRNPQMRDEIEFFVNGDETEMIKRYGIRARNVTKMFKARLKKTPVKPEYFQKVVKVAKELDLNVSEQDMKAIALACQENAVLVTADNKMKSIAEALGVQVIYTI